MIEEKTRETTKFLRSQKNRTEFIVSYPELEIPMNSKHKGLKQADETSRMYSMPVVHVQSAGEMLPSTQ